MFTGIVEARVALLERQARGTGARLLLERPETPLGGPWDAAEGDSICVSGCCLTLVGGMGESREPLAFDLTAETLDLTWFGAAEPGRLLNVERSLRIGDRLGGHLVSGHVDGRGRVAGIEDSGDGGRVIEFEVLGGFERYLVEKGSVTIDGISMTVVRPTANRFSVAAIPATLELTSLGEARPGDPVHLEADQVGKWIERLLVERGSLEAAGG